MQGDEKRYEFGKNWLEFNRKNYSLEAVEIAKQHILRFLERDNLNGLSFMDIGCGSGLHSVAALNAGAKSVYSFDYDPCSVEATKFLRAKSGFPDNWTVVQGSVLDDDFIGGIPKFDIVYSWGVLHHTGDVWRAIRNAASLVNSEGYFYIALYSANMQKDPPPEFWLNVKRKYVSSGKWTRRRMELWYIWRFDLHKNVNNFPKFLRKMREYKRNRGMNIFTDIRDWLGGWPMEFVRDEEAVDFCRDLGFELDRIVTGQANTEYLFRLHKRR